MIPPRAIVEDFGREHPGIWDAIRDVVSARTERRTSVTVPPWCYVTAEEACVSFYLLTRTHGRPNAAWFARYLRPIALAPGLAAWRLTQGVYRFDEALYAALVATPVRGRLPAKLLLRLPAWAVYIESPGLVFGEAVTQSAEMRGFFAWVEQARDGLEILGVAVDCPGFKLAVIHMALSGTIEEGVAWTVQEWRTGAARGLVDDPPPGWEEAAALALGPMLSLLLYLCAGEADYVAPPRPTPVRIKGRMRIPPPDRPTIIPVGERIGAALRAARPADPREPGDGPIQGRASPVPHVRAAHWHTFLSGPRGGERRRELRWLPPIGVRLDLGSDLAATVRPVKAVTTSL